MKVFFFAIVGLICLSIESVSGRAAFDLSQDIIEYEWNAFKDQYNKKYEDDAEHNLRQKYYLENRYLVTKHNAKYHSKKGSNADKPSFTLALNKYSDMLSHEFAATMNGYKPSLRQVNGSLHLAAHNVVIPVELDWRTEGYVTEVKDQGHCGSCWAFSATGSLEGQAYRKIRKHVSLSEQNLIDCSRKYGNAGCNGGLMENAFEYIKDNHGIDTEQTYPYEAKNDKCRYKPANKGADDVGFSTIPSGDEDALLEALATVGPISVAIDASQPSFQLYHSGVYDEPKCGSSDENLDHGVLLVGYGVDEHSGKKYWLVKNSWGKSWGEKGYIRMSRGKNNQCGIATSASYPKV